MGGRTVIASVLAAVLGVFMMGVLSPNASASIFPAANTAASSKEPLEEQDLLEGIAVPFADPTTQYFVTGFDGFPAFGFRVGASIKYPYRLFMPERFYRTFSIQIAMKPDTNNPMFPFAVTNPLENIIQLGVGIMPADHGRTNISLYYTDGERHMTSQIIASFLVPEFVGSWSRIALSVTEEDIQLWYNCEMYNDVLVRRVPTQLVFDTASTLYIGQAGGILKGELEGALQELKISNDPSLARVQCDESFTSMGSGEGRGDISFEDDFLSDVETDPETSGYDGSGDEGDDSMRVFT
ncbi:collagen alpha-1(XV) chain-like [Portunus trituberculatus]|uniref:collagen alpha-1(XV) chain-like n=1 Tax=Portunus trituberculatus TaxID=210409 RepID=UPI001E1CB81C|nr:collagen alpha-1(XV) chain-like [Portunus trituberculatus]